MHQIKEIQPPNRISLSLTKLGTQFTVYTPFSYLQFITSLKNELNILCIF